jgi:hypothetical protein
VVGWGYFEVDNGSRRGVIFVFVSREREWGVFGFGFEGGGGVYFETLAYTMSMQACRDARCNGSVLNFRASLSLAYMIVDLQLAY